MKILLTIIFAAFVLTNKITEASNLRGDPDHKRRLADVYHTLTAADLGTFCQR